MGILVLGLGMAMNHFFHNKTREFVGSLAVAVEDVQHELLVHALVNALGFLDTLLGREGWNFFEFFVELFFSDVLARFVLENRNAFPFTQIHLALDVVDL